MKKITRTLIEHVVNGVPAPTLVDDVVRGSSDLFRATTTSEGVPSDDGDSEVLRTYFDSYGDLRFTQGGVLIHDLTPMMVELAQIANIASADSGLVELMDGFEGTVCQLHAAVQQRYHLVRG